MSKGSFTGKSCVLTAGMTSYSGSAPIAPLPIAILVRFTGGSGVEKMVFVMYGYSLKK